MFTGIISHLGTILDISDGRMRISARPDLIQKLSLGMSIAVNGICLTVVELDHAFSIHFMPETAKKTNLQYLSKNNVVNLELPVTLETLFAGHVVQGHVDCVGKITNMKPEGNSNVFTITFPEEFAKYIVNKGSIAVNGISLTVIQSQDNSFTVGIIPHTWEHTMLHTAKMGDFVNIEVDILAKYLESLLINKTHE